MSYIKYCISVASTPLYIQDKMSRHVRPSVNTLYAPTYSTESRADAAGASGEDRGRNVCMSPHPSPWPQAHSSRQPAASQEKLASDEEAKTQLQSPETQLKHIQTQLE